MSLPVIPFIRTFDFVYGQLETVSPLIRRVVARNPGPFTFTGTGSFIIGQNTPGAEVAVIDPGPDRADHLAALLAATEGQRVTRIFVTHAHLDHSPLARPLADATGAVIHAGAEPCRPSDGAARLEAGDDLGFRPDAPLEDGQRFGGDGWTIEALATPGHTASHYGFAMVEENALFPGDTVMGWSTTVISPPDGDMGDYLATLERLRARRFDILWPTHGPPITQPESFLSALLAHRRGREAQIVAALADGGPTTVRALVARLYAEVDRRLHPAAAHSVLAHLLHLAARGEATATGGTDMAATYALAVRTAA